MKTLTPEKAILKYILLPIMLIAISIGINSTVNAQSKTKYISVFAPLAASVDLDQCGNGPSTAPLPCAGAQWQNGSLNSNAAHYVEGESVPYRGVFSGLSIGIVYTITLEFDSLQGGKHALDYLTSYDRTETTADPCSGFTCAGVPVTTAIPVDPNVAAGPDGILMTLDDITQVSGVFTFWNASAPSASGYTLVPGSPGNAKTQITVTFTAEASTVVLAWGGHIATRIDWGFENSAVAINGAPYHMRIGDFPLGNGGGQDRGLSADAVVFPPSIRIIKDAQPNAPQDFIFDTTGMNVATFTLDDDSNPTLSNSYTESYTSLTAGGTKTVSVEERLTPGWTFTGVSCVSQVPAGITNTPTTTSVRTVNAVLDEAEVLTCTYTNSLILASNAAISGRVLTSDGRGIRGAVVTLVNGSTGEVFTTVSSSFGYYQFNELPVGAIYLLEVHSKRFTFSENVRTLMLSGDYGDLDFYALPEE